MITGDRPSSPADIEARIQAIDAADHAPEALVERMARALFCAEVAEVGYIGGTRAWDHISEQHQGYYRRLAAAALRVVTERADGAL